MKPSRAFLGGALCLGLITCGGLTTFEVAQSSRTTIARGTLLEQLAGNLGFSELVGFDLSQSMELKNQGVERHQIDSVHIRSLTLEIAEGAEDFRFLDRLEFYVEAPGQPRRLIAQGGPFPPGVRTVTLEIPDVDLAEYAAASSMDITTNVQGRRPSQDTVVDARLLLDVDVNLGGVICGG